MHTNGDFIVFSENGNLYYKAKVDTDWKPFLIGVAICGLIGFIIGLIVTIINTSAFFAMIMAPIMGVVCYFGIYGQYMHAPNVKDKQNSLYLALKATENEIRTI